MFVHISRTTRGALAAHLLMGASLAAAPPTTVLYGGSFCPPHRTHVAEARQAARAVGASRVVLIPTSPGAVQYAAARARPGWVGVAGHRRLAMTWLATRGAPELEVSAIEVARPQPGYSSTRTLLELATRAPGPVWVLVGSDVMENLQSWARIDDLLTRVNLLVNEYPPHWLGELDDYLTPVQRARDRRVGDRSWRSRAGTEVRFVELDTGGLSSRRIREAAARGEALEAYVSPWVARYIRARGLFGWPGEGGSSHGLAE